MQFAPGCSDRLSRVCVALFSTFGVHGGESNICFPSVCMQIQGFIICTYLYYTILYFTLYFIILVKVLVPSVCKE